MFNLLMDSSVTDIRRAQLTGCASGNFHVPSRISGRGSRVHGASEPGIPWKHDANGSPFKDIHDASALFGAAQHHPTGAFRPLQILVGWIPGTPVRRIKGA